MYYSFQTDGNTDNSVAAAIAAGNIIDPLTGAIISDPVDAMRVILAKALNPIIISNPNTVSAAAKAAEDTAKATYDATLFPSTVVSAQFEIQPSSITVANGSSGAVITTLVFLDPAYSGTVTFSAAFIGGSHAGITFSAFSPATRTTPGTTSMTITVAGGTAPCILQLEVTATDGAFINKVIVGFASI